MSRHGVLSSKASVASVALQSCSVFATEGNVMLRGGAKSIGHDAQRSSFVALGGMKKKAWLGFFVVACRHPKEPGGNFGQFRNMKKVSVCSVIIFSNEISNKASLHSFETIPN